MGELETTSTLDLETFAHMVSHDLSAPLRGVSVHLKLLARDLDQDDMEQARGRIRMLQERLRRMDSMLRRIREFARVHAAHQDGPTALRDVVAHAWESLESTATLDVQGDASVATGPLFAGMVMGELLRNAVMHHDRDDGTIHVRIATSGGVVHVAVRDDGPGLPADPEALFMPFSRAGARGEEARGAGLALARYVARHVGGDVRLVAGDGRGTEALVNLPAADAQ